MNWSGGIWKVSDGVGGYFDATTPSLPSSAKNVWILNGHKVTLNVNGAANNLMVQSGGTLAPILSTNGPTNTTINVAGNMVVSGTVAKDGDTREIVATVNGDLTISGSGIWLLGTLNTFKNVYVLEGGILKGLGTGGGSVQTVNIYGSSPTIMINGQFGGSASGQTGESIRLYYRYRKSVFSALAYKRRDGGSRSGY
jgi:hypothetical protein